MATRILIEKERIRVSKPGCDANANNLEDLVISENMEVMPAYIKGSCYITGRDARFWVGFPKPIVNLPYVIMTSNDGVAAGRYTYGFETSQDNGAYRGGVIRNFDGNSRTIWYTILRGF
ncbi:hypothetical protein [uncultured Bartonella sp.]|uniref:hypothetical protein n=1 Tax=uncultured Bartonella sp. TaxID=104108 RepID=UPI0026014684|nr:hypothetical protein [uncultured Bartonella sp.]